MKLIYIFIILIASLTAEARIIRATGTDVVQLIQDSDVALEVDASANVGFPQLTASRALYLDANGDLQSSATNDTELGYLSTVTSDVQVQIDAKEPTFTKGNLTETTSSVLTIVGGTGAVIGSGLTIAVGQATTSTSGYLNDTDWDTFNNKEPTVTKGNLTETTSSVLTIVGGTGAVIGSGLTIAVGQATTSTSGYLNDTDWDIFNNKQATVSGTANETSFSANVMGLADNLVMPGTDAFTAVTGTTAQEPAGAQGQIRFDSDTKELRWHNGTAWANVAGTGAFTAVTARGAGNGGTVLTADVTNIDWTEVAESATNYDGTTFTAPSSGYYSFSGMVFLTTSVGGNVGLYVGGSLVRQVIDMSHGAENRIPVRITEYLSASDAVTFRFNSAATLSNTVNSHYMTIVKVAE